MIYVTLPTTDSERKLTYYLAAEEYVARNMPAGEYFFMWQVKPTVIFGRNQLIENEVNMEYCRAHGIRTFRRKSGGGCVYADMNNIMFSYVTPDVDVSLTFSKYVGMVVKMLRKLGLPAVASGRNDIMIEGRKVSGNAFYHIPGRSIVHGTMLYDTDMQNMVGAITPSDEKLVSKGIRSVRQHVTLLKDFLDIDIAEFKAFVKRSMCSGEVVLDSSAEQKIQCIEEEYLTPEFIYGNNPHYNITRRGRIEGVGDFVVNMEMKNDIIKNVDIKGDFFLVGDIGHQLIERLRGIKLTAQDVSEALPDRIDDVILKLKKDDFVKLVTQK